MISDYEIVVTFSVDGKTTADVQDAKTGEHFAEFKSGLMKDAVRQAFAYILEQEAQEIAKSL